MQSHIALIYEVLFKVYFLRKGDKCVANKSEDKIVHGKIAQPNVYLRPLLLTINNVNTGMDR